MALVSPGVEVTVIDESNYVPAATNSVPFILLATAENKISGTGTGVAAGTTAANAGKVYLVTSQRDLAATFGNPFFYTTTAGTPINGYELNEYGLLAAFSVLGISNRAYVMRANVDLAELSATLVRPTGAPANNTYWWDMTASAWGIFQWNETTGAFTLKTPLVLTSTTQLTGGVPLSSIGSIGDYAVVTTNANNPVYYKNTSNAWVAVGSNAWKTSWPTVQAQNSVTSALTAGQTIVINDDAVQVPASPNNTMAGLVSAINSAGITGVTAELVSNKLVLYANSLAGDSGSTGDGGLILIDNTSTGALLTTLGITAGTYHAPALLQSYSYQVPRWRSTDSVPRRTGSIWQMMSSVNNGVNPVVKRYDATLGAFITQTGSIYSGESTALYGLDPSGGGINIPLDTIYFSWGTSFEANGDGTYNDLATIKAFQRWQSGATVITGDNTNPTLVSGETFTLQATGVGSSTISDAVTVTLAGTTAADFVAAVSAANVQYVSAVVTNTGAISFVHSQGGLIQVSDASGTPLADAGFSTSIQGIRAGVGATTGSLLLSNWEVLDYTASTDAPDQDPTDGTYWYYSTTNEIDIMIQSGTEWQGYRNVALDVRGYNLTQTDPAGPIVSASAPTQQSDETDLVYGDIWIDTSNLEVYPIIKRWENVNGVDQWVAIDNTDQTTSNGVLFADARWANDGITDPITDAIPSITDLLTSDYLDVDAPDPSLYPTGMLLFNTRRSGYNVKRFDSNYFNATDFAFDSYSSTTSYATNDKVLYEGRLYVAIAPGTGNAPTNPTYWGLLETNAWVTAVGNKADGSPYMGRLAQRQLVVQAMKSAVDTSDVLREEQLTFNLIGCPNYPELMVNMVRLNNERSNTAFVVGDTPMRLPPSGTSIINWTTDNGGLGFDTGDGLTLSDPYLAVFYPACQTTDLSGAVVVQPASHMMLRTIVRSDEVAFPWLAPAGARRGVIDNASRLGYINAQTGEFESIATGQGLRDTLYENKINPITFLPGVGITNYGNKTESAIASALDRINVARLVAYIRGRLNEIGRNFVFEPNDQITRNEITNAIDGLMQDLVAKRGLYDYLIVCDLSNNTPARIDRNELYVDIAIEPVKAVEFIYIPVRIKNTGELASGQISSANSV
jgi:hypothetical protein